MALQCSDSREEQEVIVNPTVQEAYDIMVSSFTAMFSKTMEYIYGKVELEKIKEHLVLCHPPVQNAMKKCSSTETVSAIVREQVVTLVNYGHLVGLAKRFNVQEALVAVEVFTRERDEFFRSILAKEFAAVAMEKIQKSKTTHVKVSGTSRGQYCDKYEKFSSSVKEKENSLSSHGNNRFSYLDSSLRIL